MVLSSCHYVFFSEHYSISLQIFKIFGSYTTHQVYNLNSSESLATQEIENTADYSTHYSHFKKPKKSISYFTFDPNTETASEW
jgi:hypothetical protein